MASAERLRAAFAAENYASVDAKSTFQPRKFDVTTAQQIHLELLIFYVELHR